MLSLLHLFNLACIYCVFLYKCNSHSWSVLSNIWLVTYLLRVQVKQYELSDFPLALQKMCTVLRGRRHPRLSTGDLDISMMDIARDQSETKYQQQRSVKLLKRIISWILCIMKKVTVLIVSCEILVCCGMPSPNVQKVSLSVTFSNLQL